MKKEADTTSSYFIQLVDDELIVETQVGYKNIPFPIRFSDGNFVIGELDGGAFVRLLLFKQRTAYFVPNLYSKFCQRVSNR